ncbi:HNH endonuclease [Halobacillus sp. SY10]|uniref:HNH endonuclease n=1 Tax=Halobacillus sp. SY10 TaxID=3381356 RepID=UPI003879427E
MGKCEITREYLHASDVHCHHYVPKNLGGSDQFQNLRILHKVCGVEGIVVSSLEE